MRKKIMRKLVKNVPFTVCFMVHGHIYSSSVNHIHLLNNNSLRLTSTIDWTIYIPLVKYL